VEDGWAGCRVAAYLNKRINADGGDALFFYPSSVAAAGYAGRYLKKSIHELTYMHK